MPFLRNFELDIYRIDISIQFFSLLKMHPTKARKVNYAGHTLLG